MSDEFESLSDRLPDFGSVLMQRAIAKKNGDASPTATSTSGFDPYQVMIKKKAEEIKDIDPSTIQKWPEEDVRKLEDYCKKVGIVGFSAGRMHPLMALSLLKKQFGEFADVPLDERVPAGYEKRGTPSSGNSNYPYSLPINKKQIICG